MSEQKKKSCLHQNNFVDDTTKRQEAISLPGSNLVESFGHREYGEASYRGIPYVVEQPKSHSNPEQPKEKEISLFDLETLKRQEGD